MLYFTSESTFTLSFCLVIKLPTRSKGDIQSAYLLLFLRFLPSCSADCPSLRLFIQSTRNQCSVKPLRTPKPLHANVVVVEEEKEGKLVNREWCEVVEV